MDDKLPKPVPEESGIVRWRRWRLRLIIALVILLAGVILPVFDSVTISTRPHVIHVHVVDRLGIPIQQATVYLSAPSDQYSRDLVARGEIEISDLNKGLRDGAHRLTDTNEHGEALVTGSFITRWSGKWSFSTWGEYELRGDLQVTHPNYKEWKQSLASYFQSGSASINREARIEVVLLPE